MSYLIYNDHEVRNPNYSGPSPHSLNSNRQFKKHLENWFFLKLTLMNGDRIQRHQASKELEIADRKLSYWANKRNFNLRQAETDIKELQSKWQINDQPKS